MRPFVKKVEKHLEVYLADERILTVDRSFARSELLSWDVATKNEFFERFLPLEERYAFRVATNKLSRRSMHSRQLTKVLGELYFSEGAIEAALRELEHLGLINDHDFEAHFVQKLQKQGKSTREITLKAANRGIAAKALAAHFGSEEETLRALVERRYPALLEKNTPYAEKQKGMGALYRRGFSPATIAKVLNGLVN